MTNLLSTLAGLFSKKDSAVVALAPAALPTVAPIAKSIGATEILASVASMSVVARDQAFKAHVLAGDMPSWMKKPVEVTVQGGDHTLTFRCLPDYLCVGNDDDFLSIPMPWDNAHEIAASLGCVLPTRKMVQLIYAAAATKLTPHPMTPGPQMQSTDYVVRQNASVEAEKKAKGAVNGSLLAGHKKDVASSAAYRANPGKEAIYGWQQSNGFPIQPLSFAHDIHYSDYSHGARLVSAMVYLDGVETPIAKVLADPALCWLLSDEGPFVV